MGGGGTPGNSWWGCAARFSKSWSYFRPKNVIPHPFSDQTSKIHTRFQTLPLGKIMSSLLRLESKQKISSNVFRICIFLFSCSYSFGIETINTFVHSRSSIENYTRFQTKMGKSIPVFRPKRPKIHTLCGGTNLHGLYRGVQPHRPATHLPRASQKGTNEVQSNLALRTPA